MNGIGRQQLSTFSWKIQITKSKARYKRRFPFFRRKQLFIYLILLNIKFLQFPNLVGYPISAIFGRPHCEIARVILRFQTHQDS